MKANYVRPARPAVYPAARRAGVALICQFLAVVLVACTGPETPATPPLVAALQPTAVPATATLPPTQPAVLAPPTFTPAATRTATPARSATTTPRATSTPSVTPKPSLTPTPSDTPTPSPSPTPERTPLPPLLQIMLPGCTDPGLPTPTPVLHRPPRPDLPRVPGAPTGYLDKIRLIGFYGSPEGRGLGILGNQPRNQTAGMIWAVINQFRPYSDDGRHIMPLFHMISTVAKPAPGPLGYYNYHVDKSLIYDWLVTAERHNAAVVLDIQPGRAPLMEEFNRIREFLYDPHVHLAIDPEFRADETQIPGQQIGALDAADINAIQAEMNQIALELGVNRVLIIHQFKDSMITNKQDIVNFPHVELVIDGDGYGWPGPKIRNYLQYASEPGFEYGGFKLFSDQVDCNLIYDVPFMAPEEVMTQLSPQPVIIIFQ